MGGYVIGHFLFCFEIACKDGLKTAEEILIIRHVGVGPTNDVAVVFIGGFVGQGQSIFF